MKKQINLLPWRLKLHREQSRKLLYKLFVMLLIAFSLLTALHYLSRQISAQITERQTALQQINNQLIQLERQIIKSRQNYIAPETQFPVESGQVEKLLDSLTRLPLQQGELTRLRFDYKRLELAGITENQAEFERINRFLTEHPLFGQVTLSQFIPQTDGSLHFQFTLDLEATQ